MNYRTRPSAAHTLLPLPKVKGVSAADGRTRSSLGPTGSSRSELGGADGAFAEYVVVAEDGAIASKPVMEGKAVLFKRFADIDVFDIEIDTADPKEVIRFCEMLAPTLGGINLEDIKAPECFEIEEELKRTTDIPVFHDDQHGTAIVVGAAAKNALHVAGKSFEDIKVVSTGGGAAGIACLNMLLKLGVRRENIWLCDLHGLVYVGREEDMNDEKARYAADTDKRTLAEAMVGSDVFLGVSVAGALSQEMVQTMAAKPIIFALANPNPEIDPEEARAVAPKAMIATGRSDYPNQVNNVLGFPFIFRGALDVRARAINSEMQIAAVEGLCALAREPVLPEVLQAYQLDHLEFGPDYIIPKPFDPRLMDFVPPAVAQAAVDSGVARGDFPKHYKPAPQR